MVGRINGPKHLWGRAAEVRFFITHDSAEGGPLRLDSEPFRIAGAGEPSPATSGLVRQRPGPSGRRAARSGRSGRVIALNPFETAALPFL